MSNFLFVNGQIRAQESKLLNVNRLDRMIGAKTPEEAFRVFVELQYSEYFDDNIEPKDFAKVIQQGLKETRKLIVSGTENAPGLQILWLRFDINNLKRALKLKYLEGKTSIEDFSEEGGFSDLGNLNQKFLEEVVFEGKTRKELPDLLKNVVDRTEAILAEHDKAFRFVEYALDQAYFATLNIIVKKSISPFLKELFAFMVDRINFRNLARSIFILEEPLVDATWIGFGNVAFTSIQEIKTVQNFIAWTSQTRFSEIGKELDETLSKEENLVKIEKSLDAAYQKFLDQSVLGEIGSIQIPFAYFERRLRNARLLRFVMFAKFHDINSEEIYKTLAHF
ncbi:V-type ATPase subunit [Candidatus Gracilibacteria bacterium]|nr:V-type ATPase subunit [Candidatus Gracilibacteria bacterium]